MTDEELLADTNRLLKRLIEIDEERRATSADFKAKWEVEKKEMEVRRKETMSAKLKELGLPEDAADADEGAMEARLKEVRQRSKENLEIAKQKQQVYQDELLAELKAQSELLQKIAVKLGA